MAVTESTLETTVEAIAAAIESEDYAEARKQLLKARAYLIALPNSTIDGVQTQYREALDSFEAQLRLLQQETAQAAGGRTRYVRPV